MNAGFINEKMVRRIARELCKAVGDDPDESIPNEGTTRWRAMAQTAEDTLEKILLAPKIGVIYAPRNRID